MPIQRFEMLSDRTGYKSARARRAILEVIASKANANGTGSFVNDGYIVSKVGFTEKHIREQRKNLRLLGLLTWTDKRGFQGDDKGWGSNLYTVATGEHWPRRHGIKKLFKNHEASLNTEVSDELNTEVSELNQEVSEVNQEVSEVNQEVSGLNTEVSELNQEVITSPIPPLDSLPPLEPTALPTALAVTEKDLDWVVGFFVNNFGQVKNKKQVAALFEERKPEAVKGTIEVWRNKRAQGFDGLKDPFGALVREIGAFYNPNLETSARTKQRMQEILDDEQAENARNEEANRQARILEREEAAATAQLF
jgi:hypothetical protein